MFGGYLFLARRFLATFFFVAFFFVRRFLATFFLVAFFLAFFLVAFFFVAFFFVRRFFVAFFLVAFFFFFVAFFFVARFFVDRRLVAFFLVAPFFLRLAMSVTSFLRKSLEWSESLSTFFFTTRVKLVFGTNYNLREIIHAVHMVRRNMNKHNAIIFDLDGTLVDSLQDIADALNHALNQLGCRRADKALVRRWVGDGLPMLCRRAMTHAGDPNQADKLLETVRTEYEKRCTQTTRCYPNILQMLDLLQSASIPLAVLSNKPHRFVERVLDALTLTSRFVSARGYRDEKDKKPSPRQAVALAKLMGVSPAHTYFVGDSLVDIQTARNAGMKAVAVTWGFREKTLLQTAKPDFMLDDPLELNFVTDRDAG